MKQGRCGVKNVVTGREEGKEREGKCGKSMRNLGMGRGGRVGEEWQVWLEVRVREVRNGWMGNR